MHPVRPPILQPPRQHLRRPNFDEEIASHIIKRLKTTAEAFLCGKVSHAVIVIPPNFNDIRRQSVNDAAGLARIEILRVVNEPNPTAAGIAYGLDKIDGESNFLVFNLNSRSFVVTLENIDQGVFEDIGDCEWESW